MHYELPKEASKPLLIKGNSFDEIKLFADNSFDALVMDLPYLIEFMGLEWDKPSEGTAKAYTDFFKECFRILKSGGRMLIFTGSTNYDLFVNWCRTAKFNVEPMLAWVYTSGMPHGVNAVKYLIKQNHLDIADPWTVESFNLDEKTLNYIIKLSKEIKGKKEYKSIQGIVPDMFKKFVSADRSSKTSKNVLLSKLRYLHAEYFGYSVIAYDIIKSDEYPTGYKYKALLRNRSRDEKFVEGECTDFMRYFDGFNSGIKPALEPIAHLIKPLTEGSVVANMQKYGTGGLNVKDCMIPLDGMQGVDVTKLIVQLKIQFGLLPPEALDEYQEVDIERVLNDMEDLSQDRELDPNDSVFTNSIRDRLNSGGSNTGGDLKKALADATTLIQNKDGRAKSRQNNSMDNNSIVYSKTASDVLYAGERSIPDPNLNDSLQKLTKAFDDFSSQVKANDRRAKAKSFKGFQAGDKVFSENISDCLNAGGRSVPDPNIDTVVADMKKRIVGFNGKTNELNTFSKTFNDSMHSVGSSQSDSFKDAIKFMKGSHEMYGSSGSGVMGYNTDGKILKEDVDKAIATAKQIHRKVNMKASGSGIYAANVEKDPSEAEIREINKIRLVPKEAIADMKEMYAGSQRSAISNKHMTVYDKDHENRIGQPRPELENLNKTIADLDSMATRHDPTKHKGAIFGAADMPMDNNTAINFNMITFFEKMLGRYPTNVITTEKGALNKAVIPSNKSGAEYDKIFLVPKPTGIEKKKGIPQKYWEELHKTVKPFILMNHLIKLVTPRGEANPIIGDFFMGSGTTIMAAKFNNIRSVGIEIDAIYFAIAKHRIESIVTQRRIKL